MLAACGVAPAPSPTLHEAPSRPAEAATPPILAGATAPSLPPIVLPAGALAVRSRDGEPVIIERQDRSVVATIPNARAELHSGANRLLVFQRAEGPSRWGWLSVFDTTSGEQVGLAPIASDDVGKAFPRFAVSHDGKRVGWALGNVGVLEVASGKTIYLERQPFPGPGAEPGAPIFASDGSHVCVETHGALEILPMPRPPLGLQPVCFVWSRSATGGTSAFDEDALVVNLPLLAGYEEMPAVVGAVVPKALSADHAFAVVSEVSVRNAGSRAPLRISLLAFDVENAKILARLAAPSVDALPAKWSVDIDANSVGYCTAKDESGAPCAAARFDLEKRKASFRRSRSRARRSPALEAVQRRIVREIAAVINRVGRHHADSLIHAVAVLAAR